MRPEDASKQSTDETPRPLQGRRVLVVEDDSDTLQIMQFVLERHGAQVLPANSVPAALDQIESYSPEVVVADIGMRGLNGYALIAEVRKMDAAMGRHTPAIAVTGFATPQDREAASAAGFAAYITKPFDPHVLIDTVAQLVQGSKEWASSRSDPPQ
jgi:CheY-like chemotaxis protein